MAETLSFAPDGPGTPSSIVGSRLTLSKRQLQEKVNYQRGQIIKHGKARGLSNAQINPHIQKLYANADQKAMQLTQEAETQTAGLDELDQFGRIGGVTPETLTRAKYRMLGGPEADRMIAEPKPRDPVAEYRREQSLISDLEVRDREFRLKPGTKRLKDPYLPWFLEPKGGRPSVQISTGYRDEDDKPIFRDASPNESQEFWFVRGELGLAKKRRDATIRGPDVANRLQFTAATSGRMTGGSFADQTKEMLKERKPVGEMSIEELEQEARGR